ncbi:MAG TPA: hypothetical protein VFJ19_05670 [Nocardioidaceae bacterium]|nr:hypothetical protein [Nocardioidaceae bacterium]
MSDNLAAYTEHFRARVLQDALNEATPRYWRRRAEQFAAVGNARCDEVARACRNHAEFLTMYPLVEPGVLAAIREAA